VSRLQLSAGFTFVEILIVVMIMGIIATISLPALNETLEDTRLRGAADEVVTALEYAQLTAMTSGRETRVNIESNDERIDVRQYTTNADLFNGGDELAAADVENGTYELMPYPSKKGVNYSFDFPDVDRFKGVDITISDFDNINPVFFDAQGAPSRGGSATLALGSSQIVVTMDALTGKVSVSE
jgi:type II secretion system protein H